MYDDHKRNFLRTLLVRYMRLELSPFLKGHPPPPPPPPLHEYLFAEIISKRFN